MTAATPLPGLLRTLTQDPGRPRLTWYAPQERIELSGHVLDNWVTKTANLLVEEHEAGPGTLVVLDLPVHWRLVVWALGTWRTGAGVVLAGSPAGTVPGSVVVTTRPEAWVGAAGRPDVVAVALPSLARAFDGTLPPGSVDGNAAVMGYGDVLTYMPPARPDAAALALADRAVDHAHLLGWAHGTLQDEPRPAWADDVARGDARRVLLEPADETASRAAVLAATLAVYVADGSVVLCDAATVAELAEDTLRRDRLLQAEQVG